MAESTTDPTVESQEMQIEYMEDKAGAKLKLQVVDGMYFPTFPADVIKNMSSVKIRDNDVILAGYLKAGTHWVWEILRMLLTGTTDVPEGEKDEGMMEQTHQDVLDSMPSPRVLNTHVPFEKLPTEVMTRKPKIVYLTRNPKDTAVSLYHHHKKLQSYYSYDGIFENYLHLFVEGKVDYGSWFDHIKNWSEAVKKYPELQIYMLNYEELSKDTEEGIKKLAAFLGLSPPENLVNKIKDECTIDRMRDKKGKFDLDTEGKPIMYRKGKVGDWKNYFNENCSWFDSVYESKMATIDTPFYWLFELE